MTRRPQYREWTQFDATLVKEVETGVELVIRRRATVALAHKEDITQDINEIIQRRFFAKGRTLHEGVLRKLISQEALTKHQRTYYPKMTEAQIRTTQCMVDRMLDNGVTVLNGYSGELLNDKEWELAKALKEAGWSATRASEATGIPIGTVLRRREMIYYKLTTYNQARTETYPVSLTVMLDHNADTQLEQTEPATQLPDIGVIMEASDCLTQEDKTQIADYLAGKHSSQALDTILNRMDRTGQNITSEHREALQELRETHKGKESLEASLNALEGLTDKQRSKLLEFLTSEPMVRELQDVINRMKENQ